MANASAPYSFLDRQIRRYGGRLRHRINKILARYSEIGDPPVFDPAIFDWTPLLQRHWRTIQAEAEQVLSRQAGLPSLVDLSPDHAGINADGGWRSFFLWGYGFRIDDACACCPETTRLVEQIPGLMTAMFSVHVPGTHLSRHRGVTKGMITVHLPLKVPRDAHHCRIDVDGQVHQWREGELFAFDDTYAHETWNDTDEVRILLLLHVRRPLQAPGSWLRELFFWAIRRTAFVRDAHRNIEAWSARVDQIERAEAERYAHASHKACSD